MRLRSVWTALLLMTLGGSAFAQSGGARPPGTRKNLTRDQQQEFRQLLGALTDLSYSRTPFLPIVSRFALDRPAEEIRVRKARDGLRLRVTINYIRRGVSRRTITESKLSQAEWETLVRTVVTERLLDWKPLVSEGQRPTKIDSMRFAISGKTVNKPYWFGAIDNPAPPESLRNLLAALADRKLPSLPLHFLYPEE